jgi:hypothetical protein
VRWGDVLSLSTEPNDELFRQALQHHVAITSTVVTLRFLQDLAADVPVGFHHRGADRSRYRATSLDENLGYTP